MTIAGPITAAQLGDHLVEISKRPGEVLGPRDRAALRDAGQRLRMVDDFMHAFVDREEDKDHMDGAMRHLGGWIVNQRANQADPADIQRQVLGATSMALEPLRRDVHIEGNRYWQHDESDTLFITGPFVDENEAVNLECKELTRDEYISKYIGL
jgi:hypothetical protein